MNFFNILKKDNKKWEKNTDRFDIYFVIRTILIIDKKNLDINYLDLNIKKYM